MNAEKSIILQKIYKRKRHYGRVMRRVFFGISFVQNSESRKRIGGKGNDC